MSELKIANEIIEIKSSINLLDQTSLKNTYFSCIYYYLNYANITWASNHITISNKIRTEQKHAARIVFNKNKVSHSRPLLRSLNPLSVYQINLYQHLINRNLITTKTLAQNFQFFISKTFDL